MLARVLNRTTPGSVLNVHVSGESTKDGGITQIRLPHMIAPGPVKNEDYGLDLARRFLSERVINNAEQVSKFLRDKHASKGTGPATRAAKQNKLILALPDLLKQAYNSTMDDSALASYLKKLQTEFTIRMNLAADDGAQNGQGDEGKYAAFVQHPVLEAPSEEELAHWNAKCDKAERRVMHANMAHSQDKKRSSSTAQSDVEYMQKRNRPSSDTEGTVSQATPINRGSLIEQLRKGACTPTTRAATPSSFMADSPDAEAESVIEATSEVENSFRQGPSVARRRSAASVSPGSSVHDDEMPGIDQENGSPNTPSPRNRSCKPSQPLQQFQPLKQWYAREQESGASSLEEQIAGNDMQMKDIALRSAEHSE